MKHTSYGFDVLALVGQLRFKQYMTIGEITKELNHRGVATSERNSQRLYERYLTLLRASVTDHVKQVLKQVAEDHGGIMISMDGVQPEKGNETLYVIREVFSGIILAAQNLKSGSAEELKKLIMPVMELGFPIIGIVTDGQQSIRIAMESLLPNVPYQYCQYHYLKDIAKPIVDVDRKLKTGIKKSLRGIRENEKKIENDTSVEAEVVKDYVAAIRSVLLEDGNPPLDLPGIRVYENAKAIQDSLERCLSKKGPSILQNLIRIFNKLDGFKEDYTAVKRWALPLHHVADILKPEVDKSSETVQFHMQQLLNWVEQTYTGENDQPMVANL